VEPPDVELPFELPRIDPIAEDAEERGLVAVVEVAASVPGVVVEGVETPVFGTVTVGTVVGTVTFGTVTVGTVGGGSTTVGTDTVVVGNGMGIVSARAWPTSRPNPSKTAMAAAARIPR
jgi:hypothetical protein